MKNAWRSLDVEAALLILLAVVVYLPTLHGSLLWDDATLITENDMVRASDGLYRFWFTAEAPDYRPVTWSLWWLEWRLWGKNPLGYHVVNVVLHAGNAILVWLILRRLKIPGAWLAAAVFATHPVNVATVGWISEQKNTLSMLFYAASIWFYLKFDESDIVVGPRGAVGPRCRAAVDAGQDRVPTTDTALDAEHPDSESGQDRVPTDEHSDLCHRGIWRWYGLSLASGLLALLSKTAIVTLPVVLLGCVSWRHGRLRTHDWLCSVPFFVASLALSLVTIVQHQQGLPEVVRTGGFAARLAVAGWIPWFYLSKALWPVNLTVIYPKWEVDASRWVSYVPGIILIGCFVVFWRKRGSWGRPVLFGLGYFMVMLFPVLGFFDQGFYRLSLVADHWQYHAIIGVIALTVAGGQEICSRLGGKSWRVGALIGGTVVAALAMGAWNRSCVYASGAALWRDNVAKYPGAWPHYYLGFELQQAGKLDEAVDQFEQALRINPNMAHAHNNLGMALRRMGRLPEAISHYEQALKIKPDMNDAHDNLGVALLQLGRVTEAMAHWEQALRIKPDDAGAHNNLGVALARTGKIDDAIGHFEQAVRINPYYAEAQYGLGVALERAGRLQGAIEHLEQAVRLKPDFAEAQNRLARIRTELAVRTGR